MKTRPVILLLVMAAAILMISVLSVHYRDLSEQLKTKEGMLAASREAWEKTAAEKEALQVELKQLKDELKEARLSLDEAVERSGSIRKDIEDLNNEISLLEAEIQAK